MPSTLISRWRPELLRGPSVELLDSSVFLLVWALVGYVILPTPMATLAAAGAPLVVISEHQLGIGLTVVAAAGIAMSWSARWSSVGAKLVRVAVLFMLLNFTVTLVRLVAYRFGVGHFVTPDTAGILRSTLLNILIYGSVMRRLDRGHHL